jgi:hypothetical protein
MEIVQRKPRQFFDRSGHAVHVTFDDGKDWRRSLPWLHFARANWSYADPDTIRVVIDDWIDDRHSRRIDANLPSAFPTATNGADSTPTSFLSPATMRRPSRRMPASATCVPSRTERNNSAADFARGSYPDSRQA